MTDAGSLIQRLRRFVSARLHGGSDLGLRLTIDIVLFAAGVWAFSGLLEEVLDREGLVRWDLATAARFRAHVVPSGLRAFAVVAQFGGPVTYVLMGLVALLLWRRGERLMLWTWITANGGGKLLEYLLKSTVQRTRPQFAREYLDYESFSFPSGHAMSATVTYFMLAFVMTELAGWTGRRRLLVNVVAGIIVIAVSFSRLYLGVHYPSDVLGGIIAGAAWLALCVITLRIVRREPHHKRERDGLSRSAAD